MMPNVSYGPMLNPTMTRGASLGSGIRSLLGLGNARNFAGGVSRGINWSSLLNNTSKTLSVVREAIPIVKEVGPMMNNMKSMLKVASVFKDATDVNNEHKPNNNINNNIKVLLIILIIKVVLKIILCKMSQISFYKKFLFYLFHI